VKLVDANVLLYAANEDDARHEQARSWLDDALSGATRVGFAWVVLLAFVRLSTRAHIFPRPLTTDGAMDRVDDWTGQPPAVIVDPGPAHGGTLRRLLSSAGTGGNLTTDAHLAALAVDHRAEIVTYDDDFGRFPDVRWTRPTPPR
jgi:hypothetical protein